MNTYAIDGAETLEYTRQLELHIIGCPFVDAKCLYDIEDLFKSKYFYFESHKKLVDRINERFQRDINEVDFVTMAYDFQKCEINLVELVESIPTVANVRHYCQKLKSLHLWREARKVANGILSKGLTTDDEEIREAISEVQSGLERIENEGLESQNYTKDMMAASMELIDFLDDETPDRALRSGLLDLDRLVGGFQPGQMTVIGARPSMGKTAISLSFLDHFSLSQRNTLYFSFEMPTRDMIKRLVSMNAHVDLHRMNIKKEDGKRILDDEEYEKITEAIGTISNYPVLWHDRTCRVVEMKTIAKAMQRKQGLDVIVIDHLSKVTPNNMNAPQYEQRSQTIRDIKDMAKELDVHVIVLSQLSRAVEQRNDKRPILADLRETGQIEEEADLVLFLYRDEYYYPEETEKKNIMEIIAAKHRNGPVGAVEAMFLKQYAKVLSLYKS